jgi:alkanesulfonate monooxygenase SsuD/methylene tetrahydromethanopterin reductase-like flavin-dependent oxidoreductase (luciferase family)
LRETGAAGTPEQVSERLRAYADLGARRSYLQFPDPTDLDQLDLIAAEVMPLVR